MYNENGSIFDLLHPPRGFAFRMATHHTKMNPSSSNMNQMERDGDHNLPKSRTNFATESRNSGVEPSSASPLATL